MVIKWNMNNMEKDFWEAFLHLFFLMLWPILTNWCTKGSYRSGRIPASREFLSFIRSLSKWECNVVNRGLHRIHPISGTLPCFHYWSKGGIGKCATVVKLSWITVRHISEIFVCTGAMGEHCWSPWIQKTLSECPERQTCQRQINFLRLLQEVKATTHFHTNVWKSNNNIKVD